MQKFNINFLRNIAESFKKCYNNINGNIFSESAIVKIKIICRTNNGNRRSFL